MVTRLIFLLLIVSGFIHAQESCKFSVGKSDLTREVKENTPVGSEVMKLQVFPRNKFSLASSEAHPTDVTFFRHEEVGSRDVIIRLAKSLEDLLDQENPKTALRFKMACVGSNGTEIVHVPVEVRIKDVNDHVPEFVNAPYNLEINELTPVGSTVFRGIKAVDDDQPKSENSRIVYVIKNGNTRDTFSISDRSQGHLVLNRPLDYDEGSREFHLEIQAQDQGSPSLTALTTVNIRIQDTDDQNPTFTQDLYQVRIREKSSLMGLPIREKLHIVPRIEAYDKDKAINSSIKYSILSGNDKKFFDVGVDDGSIYVVQEIDREALAETSFSLQIQAAQSDNSLRQGLARVDIEVLDINDNPPIFDTKWYNISILENAPNGFSVTQVHATDADMGENANFRYRLEDPSGAFEIDSSTGWITVADLNKLDREINSKLKFKVFADEEVTNVIKDIEPSFTTVEVQLLDTNDNNPIFIPKAQYVFNVSELAQPEDGAIGAVFARDPDLGENGAVFYYLPNDTSTGRAPPFRVDPRNGSVYVTQVYSSTHDKPLHYTMFVAAADRPLHPKERRFSLAAVTVNVIDANNNAPELLGMPYEGVVGENLPEGTLVLEIRAKDSDLNTKLSYSLVETNETSKFTIDENTGMITTLETLDYEETSEYSMVVEVSDGLHVSAAAVTVYVIDVNDHVPQFTQSKYQFSVAEDVRPDTMLGKVKAIDEDQNQNGHVLYKFVEPRVNETFSIDPEGSIHLIRRLDREREAAFQFTVTAYDQGFPSLASTASVEVTVMDVNDNQPRFTTDRLLVEIPEELKPPVFLLRIQADDPDEGENAEVHYAISSGNQEGDFMINETTGEVSTRRELDFETQPTYLLNVTAKNIKPLVATGKISLPSIMQLFINVEDRHDSLPNFQKSSYEFSVPEKSRANIVVGVVNATDEQTTFEQKMSYWLGPRQPQQDAVVAVMRSTGEIVLKKSMDFDPPKNERELNFIVFAKDEMSINSKANTSVNVTIKIIDVNDNKPVFSKDTYQLVVSEDTPVNATLPLELKVTDIDSGINGEITSYSILTDQNVFNMDEESGEITLAHALDYETEQRFILQVAAKDGGKPALTGSVVVMINLANVNEFPPKFSNQNYSFTVGPNYAIGGRVGQVKATDGDGNAIKYNFIGGDVSFFRIDDASGQIFSQVELNGREDYSLRVVAVDDGRPKPLTSAVTVNIRAQAPNNYSPVFLKPIYDAVVKEKDSSGQPVVRVAAKDDDQLYNNVTFSILEGNPASIFAINPLTGDIVVDKARAQLLDFDSQNIHPLAIQAKDNHSKPRTAITMVIVVVEDTNDHPPTFGKEVSETSIKENLKRGKCFFKVQASSGDSVDRVQYSILNSTGPFVIHSTSGQICTEDVLDRERAPQYELIVQANDGKYSSTTKVIVSVSDENDNTPQFEKDMFTVVVPNDAKAGTKILRLHVFDPDEGSNGEVTFWASNMYGLYDINSTTGEIVLLQDLNGNDTDTLIYETDIFVQDHGSEPRRSKANVVIRVTPTGGHPPIFSRFIYQAVVPERVAPIEVTTVSATSASDAKLDSKVRYDIVRVIGKDVSAESFDIDEVKGVLVLTKALDYDVNRFIQVVIEAKDEARDTLASETVVQIRVADVNSHRPRLFPLPKVLRIPVSHHLGDVIYKLQATDDDFTKQSSANLTFDMDDSVFGVEAHTGNVLVVKRLIPGSRNVSVVVRDQGFPPLETQARMSIEVYDDKSTRATRSPIFPVSQYYKEYPGQLSASTQLFAIQAAIASDEDLVYNITRTSCGNVFALHPQNGRLITTRPIPKPLCHLAIQASIKGEPEINTEIIATIKSSIFSNTCPKFILKEYRASVAENSPVGELVFEDIEVDKPEKFPQLVYKITTDTSNGHFYLESSQNVATLKIKKKIDREKMAGASDGRFTLRVTVTRNDMSNCSDWTTLSVRVEDINDNTPIFPQTLYEVVVKENSAVDSVSAVILAVDPDQVDEKRLNYAIVDGNAGGYFQMDAESGVIKVVISPDREVTPSFELLISATDTGNNTGISKVHFIVEDANDQTPKFVNDTIVLIINEGPSSVNSTFTLPAIDGDEGDNRKLSFKILKGDEQAHFKLQSDKNHVNGILTVVKELDREAFIGQKVPPVKELLVQVSDAGSPQLSSTAVVFILIEDVNDQAPQFTQKIYKEVVFETSPVGLPVTKVLAVDKDSDDITNLTYSFEVPKYINASFMPFDIDNETGVVTVNKQLDFAEQNVYNITLLVTDGKFLSKGLLQIHVKEQLEPQARSASAKATSASGGQYLFRVRENASGVKVGQIVSKISKWKVNRPKMFSILDPEASRAFNIDTSGAIFTTRGLDREKREAYSFVVLQEDRKRPEHKETYQVQIVVDDVNDEAPVFSTSYVGTIAENSPTGTLVNVVPAIEATDKDSGINSVVVYFLAGRDHALFRIDEVHGKIRWIGDNDTELDRESKDRYVLLVGAMDLDNLTSTTNLTVTVSDVNDNPPKFIHGARTVEILETTPTGQTIARVTAIDSDAAGKNSEVIYSIISDTPAFRVNPLSGEVILVKSTEPETSVHVNVSATDGGGLSSTTVLTVKTIDVNNHAPRFSDGLFRFAIAEGRYSTHPITLARLTANDKDFGKNAIVTYKLIPPIGIEVGLPFKIDSSSGSLNISGDIDRETIAAYRFHILAEDQGSPSLNSTTEVVIDVLDTNDEAPRFVGNPYNARIPENKDPGQWVVQVKAVDFDSNATGNGQVSYKLSAGHDGKFYIDSRDGNVWTLATLDFEKQDTYNITVIAYDAGEPSLSSTAMLYVRVVDTVDIVPDFLKSLFTLEVAENTSPGSVVYKLDSGSDKFTYSVQDDDGELTFAVDNRTGEITLLKHLDSERRSHYKLQVVSRDNVLPVPNEDTTIVNIIVGSGQGLRMFSKRHYEVTIMENRPAPTFVFDMNATDDVTNKAVDYKIIGNTYGGLFTIDSSSGKITVTKSLDREVTAKYHLRVRADKTSGARHHRASGASSSEVDLSYVPSNEALLTVLVGDENDNGPVFTMSVKGKPVVVAVPADVTFGREVLRLTARDADEGENSDVVFHMIERDSDDSRKFHVDPKSGVVRSLVPLALDGNRLFGFQVKASDRGGEDGAKSVTEDVSIHVLSDTKMVVLVIRNNVLVVEQQLAHLTSELSNITGYDVKVCKMEAHMDNSVIDPTTTDVYTYAVDPVTNNIVEVDAVLSLLKDNLQVVQDGVKDLNVLRAHDVVFKQKSDSLSVSEVALLAFGCVIFISTIIGFVTVCRRQRRKNNEAKMSSSSYWETHHKLYGMKNPLVNRTPGSSFAEASIDTQKNSCSCIIHSRPGSAGDGESQCYNDSLSSTSTLDLDKSRRPRQRAPSSSARVAAPPPPPPPQDSPHPIKQRGAPESASSSLRKDRGGWSSSPDEQDDDLMADRIPSRDRYDYTQ